MVVEDVTDEICGESVSSGIVHCFREVTWRGRRGFVGCHENFGASEAYWQHIRRGSCRDPKGVDSLRWDGVSWNVKEKDKDGRDGRSEG